MSLSLFGGPRDAQWKEVRDALDKGLPQTAITNLQPIIQGALRDKAYAEAVKAIGQRINLEGAVQGNKPEEKITRLETEIARAPKEMAPVLETLLAHWYWQYYQQNNWRFLRRTATAQAPGKDFTTWDLPRLFAEIDKHFQKALAAEAVLKVTPISLWDDLLTKGTLPDSYRPTLYDFITHEALAFYTSGEQAGAKPEDAFEVSADSPVFDPPEQFLAWNAAAPSPKSSASAESQELSSLLRAIQLYQALLRFHANDPSPRLALGDADLQRLTWANNVAFGEDKSARYKVALEVFIGRHGDSELSALALERQARLLESEDDPAGAHQLARRGAETFSDSAGARLCRSLLQELEAPSVGLNTERVWNCVAPTNPADAPPSQSGACPVITLRYRNVESVYFRAILCDWEMFLQKRYPRPEDLRENERREILARPPALEWSEALAPTRDFKERVVSLPAPVKLKPGFYFIAASHNPQFSEPSNQVSMADLWVSDLALITRAHQGILEGFVLDANSGEPLPSAAVSVWHLDNQGNRVADPTLTTDDSGFFSMRPGRNQNYLLRARFNGRELANANSLDYWQWMRNEPPPKPSALTVFFTDRAIYRPGQTIQYKGICLWEDEAKDQYDVLKGEELAVVFRDGNGKEIARHKHRANDFGSFAGSFTAPRDRLLGGMSLQVEGRAAGSTGVRVEEYKRPKFEVTLDAPKTAPRLNEKVSLSGHAVSYTGAAVDDATVTYRVVREVRMPIWWGWWGRGWPRGENQEIAHGVAHTKTDGSFQIEFTAQPDRKVPEKDEPSFAYEIHADVTDPAGETRSADHTIRVGYTALEVELTADDWQTEDKPLVLKVETKTLDGEPQSAQGSIKVYSLKPPEVVHRAELSEVRPWFRRGLPATAVDEGVQTNQDLSDPNHWPLGELAAEQAFTTTTNGATNLSFKLFAGVYRAVLETRDRFGKPVTGKLPLHVLAPASPRLGIKVPQLLAAPSWQSQPGDEFMALWGTGYNAGRAFIEIEHRNQIIQRYWTRPGNTQQQIKVAVTEAMRGGFTLHVTQVRENRAYLQSREVEVPWLNKNLELKWEHFTSKLMPNLKETWSVAIQAPKSTNQSPEREVAEMVAALYDESLDAFAPHAWLQGFNMFRQDSSSLQPLFANENKGFQPLFVNWPRHPEEAVLLSYRSFPLEMVQSMWFSRGGIGGVRQSLHSMSAGAIPMVAPPAMAVAKAAPMPASVPAASGRLPAKMPGELMDGAYLGGGPSSPKEPAAPPKPDLSQIAARKNLNETAFFYPQLTSDSNGIVRMTFTMPEALTKWRFLGFAHDRSVRSGYLEAHALTAKDLMVQPNPPRFLREGDTVEFTVKVSNQSDSPQTGVVRLTFNDALTDQPADQALAVRPVPAAGQPAPVAGSELPFAIPAKESRTFAWRLTVPDGCGFLTYKAVGAAATVSDGEEGALPVLSRRILVTESLPLPIRGPGTRKFEFTKLLQSGNSKTLRSESLTAQMVSHPAWYAVLALPYLMEYPHECSEQTFNRLYANALARTIANRDPKIRRVFDQWKNTPALDSPLEKNQDLKSVAIAETPWLRQAENESQSRRNLGILFDRNRLDYETDSLLRKLADLQLPDGGWPWFPGGRRNDYIALYITTGFGRLRHLGADLDSSLALRSLFRLDEWMSEQFREIQKQPHPENYVPSSTDALYLYGRSFFLKDRPIGPGHKPAVEFFLAQARKFWLQTGCRQTQGHLALALHRFSASNSTNDPTSLDILASLKERSVTSEEMGRFWRDTELSWWWYRAPIETQALMIEAFDEISGDQAVVEDCRVWLLKQKQTQDWKTTKATADAVYALLLRGTDLLASDALVELKLGGIDVTPKPGASKPAATQANRPEPGTGFYEARFAPADIKPKLGAITVTKTDAGVAWGSVHWQYLEDIGKITPHEGTPLKLVKSLYIKTNTGRGPVLEPVRGPLAVGDELVVRLELRVDRDMEYVHLKDQRGSGTEPVNVLSHYKYQDGLAYYESTRDTASHFFIDYLPKGAYVFEYSTRVQLRGRYQSGLAEIQCLYAPEFNSHSASVELEVR